MDEQERVERLKWYDGQIIAQRESISDFEYQIGRLKSRIRELEDYIDRLKEKRTAFIAGADQ